jgi:hypothetical protein
MVICDLCGAPRVRHVEELHGHVTVFYYYTLKRRPRDILLFWQPAG